MGTSDCKVGYYCDFPDGQCGKGLLGTCKIKPDLLSCLCTVDGVCGCDGKKYCDSCDAANKGIDIQSMKACNNPLPD